MGGTLGLHEGQQTPARPRPTNKLGIGKLALEEQGGRFIEAAREAEASEDEAVFDSAKDIRSADVGFETGSPSHLMS